MRDRLWVAGVLCSLAIGIVGWIISLVLILATEDFVWVITSWISCVFIFGAILGTVLEGRR